MTKTDEIFKLTAPYNNPYQGDYKRVLFVCSAGLLRSATAANLFAQRGLNTRSCGSSPYALIPMTTNLIAWAQEIVFVNSENYIQAMTTFDDEIASDLYDKLSKATRLAIPDMYEYNHPELIKLLEEQYKP